MYKSITEAAEALGVSRQSVWFRIHRGIIAAQRIGCTWIIDEAEIERLQTAEEVAKREKFTHRRGERQAA